MTDPVCACELPGDDPHGCLILQACETAEEVIELADLCSCDCHWPDEGARLS